MLPSGGIAAGAADGFEHLLPYETGVLAATTAFGKTIVAISMIARRGVNTLILVHRRQILDQWLERLETFLEGDALAVGRVGDGKRDPSGMIDVALIQSLHKKTGVDDSVAQYGHLVVDECHHLSAVSFENVARRCKAKYVLGLSATVARKDGHHPIIFMQCGPVRFKDDARRQADARPFAHHVIPRKTGFRMPQGSRSDKDPSITDIYAALVADEKRNDMIFDDVLKALEKKTFPGRYYGKKGAPSLPCGAVFPVCPERHRNERRHGAKTEKVDCGEDCPHPRRRGAADPRHRPLPWGRIRRSAPRHPFS